MIAETHQPSTTTLKPQTLQEALNELAFQPLDPVVVSKHMQEEIEKHPPSCSFLLWLNEHDLRGVFNALIGATSLIVLALWIALLAKVITGVPVSPYHWIAVYRGIYIYLILFVLKFLVLRIPVTLPAHWVICSFQECHKKNIAIPDYVESMRKELTSVLPSVELFILVLFQGNKSLDPVFKVEYGGETAYLAMWNNEEVVSHTY